MDIENRITPSTSAILKMRDQATTDREKEELLTAFSTGVINMLMDIENRSARNDEMWAQLKQISTCVYAASLVPNGTVYSPRRTAD